MSDTIGIDELKPERTGPGPDFTTSPVSNLLINKVALMSIFSPHIGVCSWSLKPSTAQNLVDELARVDLKTVQLNLMPLIRQQEGWGDDTFDVMTQAGVRIASGMFGPLGENHAALVAIQKTDGVIQDQRWDEHWADTRKVAKLASSKKLTQVSMHTGFIPEEADDPNFDKLAGRLKQIADLFYDSGIDLVLETGQEAALNLRQFLEALASRGTTNIKVSFNPANMVLCAQRSAPAIALMKIIAYVTQVHVKDALVGAVPGTPGEEVAVGQGKLDWPAILQVLRNADFQGELIIERETGDTRIADIKAAASLMKKLIA